MFAVNLMAVRASTAPIFLVGSVSSQGLFLANLCAVATLVSRPVLIAAFVAHDKLFRGLSRRGEMTDPLQVSRRQRRQPSRLELASELGATGVVDARLVVPRRGGIEPNVLLECSGNPAATTEALGMLARAGRGVLVGMGADMLPLPVSRIHEYELVVTGTFRYAHTWPGAIALAASGRVQLDRLVTGHYGLGQVRDALTISKTDPLAVPLVRPST